MGEVAGVGMMGGGGGRYGGVGGERERITGPTGGSKMMGGLGG